MRNFKFLEINDELPYPQIYELKIIEDEVIVGIIRIYEDDPIPYLLTVSGDIILNILSGLSKHISYLNSEHSFVTKEEAILHVNRIKKILNLLLYV